MARHAIPQCQHPVVSMCPTIVTIMHVSMPRVHSSDVEVRILAVVISITASPHKGVTINSTGDLKRVYPDRFEGIGNFGGQFHTTTDPDMTPVVHAPRRCPIALKDEIKRELDTMEEMGSFHECHGQPTGSRVWSTAGNRPGDFESASTQMISTEQSRDPTTTLGFWRRLPISLQEPRSSLW